MIEFTGERVVPGQVDADLWAAGDGVGLRPFLGTGAGRYDGRSKQSGAGHSQPRSRDAIGGQIHGGNPPWCNLTEYTASAGEKFPWVCGWCDWIAGGVRPCGVAVYSCRSALIGSTRLARNAGIKPVDPAAKVRTIAGPTNVNGSRGFNPKS